MVKKYILSIDNETKEYFDNSLASIEKQLKEEILGTPLISSNRHIIGVIERNMTGLIETVVSLMDYYTEGIYNSGKNISRKKLKLKKELPADGKRYCFTQNDELFIDKYKSNKLTEFNAELNKSIVEYVTSIITEAMQDKWRLDTEDTTIFDYSKQQLVDDEMKDILDMIKENISGIYEELMDVVSREILVLFRRAQIEEYKNLGISVVTMISEDESLCCPVCTAKSGKVTKIEDIVSEYGLKSNTQHSYCKYSIDPVISYQNQVTTVNSSSEVGQHSEFTNIINDSGIHLNNEIKTNIDLTIDSFKFTNMPIEIEYRVAKLVKKFKMYAKNFMRDIEFIFVDNISDEDDWFKNVKEHYISTKEMNDFNATNEALHAQDNLKYKVASFDNGNKYYISVMSFDSQLVEEIITRKIVKDLLKINDTVNEIFEQKINSRHIGNGLVIYQDPFVSYLAQESSEDYLLESVVDYVNQPKKLQAIDEKMFNYIKENVFNNVQFFN